MHIRQEGVGVPMFLNEPWSVTDQRIFVNVTEGRWGHIFTLVAVDSITNEPIRLFREVGGDPGNLFTVDDSGRSKLSTLPPIVSVNSTFRSVLNTSL